jgi:hypothetical protein
MCYVVAQRPWCTGGRAGIARLFLLVLVLYSPADHAFIFNFYLYVDILLYVHKYAYSNYLE